MLDNHAMVTLAVKFCGRNNLCVIISYHKRSHWDQQCRKGHWKQACLGKVVFLVEKMLVWPMKRWIMEWKDIGNNGRCESMFEMGREGKRKREGDWKYVLLCAWSDWLSWSVSKILKICNRFVEKRILRVNWLVLLLALEVLNWLKFVGSWDFCSHKFWSMNTCSWVDSQWNRSGLYTVAFKSANKKIKHLRE